MSGEIACDFNPVPDIASAPSGQNDITFVSVVLMSYWHTTPNNAPVDKDDAKENNFHVRNAKVLTLIATRHAPIVDPTKLSCWPRLIMTTARVMSPKTNSGPSGWM